MNIRSFQLQNNHGRLESIGTKEDRTRRAAWLAGLLIAAVVVQTLLLIWLFGLGPEALRRRISFPDTAGYVSPAESIAHGNGLPADMIRTVGYPLFLVVPFWLGGEQYGYFLAIVIQSILNLVGTILFWKFIVSLLPQIRNGVLVATAAIFWYAAFGLALNVLSDFLFGFLLLVFLYTFWVKRGGWWIALGAGALLAAGLTRPALGPFLLLLPVLWILVRRKNHGLPITSLVAYAVAIIISSVVNFGLENARAMQRSQSFTASAILVAISDQGLASKSEVARRIGELAGRPYNQLTRREQDTVGRRVFFEYVSGHPVRFLRGVSMNAVKIVISPLEGAIAKVAVPDNERGEIFARSLIRGIVLLVGVPIWAFAFWPGMARRSDGCDIYVFSMFVTLYFVGLASAFAGGGERYRFPGLPMLLLCFAYNLDSFVRKRMTLHRASA